MVILGIIPPAQSLLKQFQATTQDVDKSTRSILIIMGETVTYFFTNLVRG
jgi:hypothetical protein